MFTHSVEGAFAVWEYQEIIDILGDTPAASLFCHFFFVQKGGNVAAHHDIHGELAGKNVLMDRHSIEEIARQFNVSVEEVKEIIEGCKMKLAEVREKRPKPHRDDKVITAWNGKIVLLVEVLRW